MSNLSDLEPLIATRSALYEAFIFGFLFGALAVVLSFNYIF